MSNRQLLERVVESLIDIREHVHDKVEPSVITEFDLIIIDLRNQLDRSEDATLTLDIAERGLRMIAIVIEATLRIDDLIIRLFQ